MQCKGSGERIPVVALLAWLLFACATPRQSRETQAPEMPLVAAPARTVADAGMRDIAELVPDIDLDIRYAGTHNFIGRPVEGYDAGKCLLLKPVAQALAAVERELRGNGLRLRLYDCYRPVRAVMHFVRWAADPDDTLGKREFYPALDKAELIPGGYISDRSGHSKGATVDLGLLRCVPESAATPGGRAASESPGHACEVLDMGTPFDFFDAASNTDHPEISDMQRRNRQLLRNAMERHGFANYPMEWWHYTFRLDPAPQAFFDIPVR